MKLLYLGPLRGDSLTGRTTPALSPFRPAEAADESELYRIVGHCERDRP
jgi:hypothetical protein